LHKFNLRKPRLIKELGYDGGTEYDMAKALNYHRIWDCGKIKFTLL